MIKQRKLRQAAGRLDHPVGSVRRASVDDDPAGHQRAGDTLLFRITVEPDDGNGLRKLSQVMVDKAQTVPREKIGEPFGRLDDATMLAVTRALAVFLGFA